MVHNIGILWRYLWNVEMWRYLCTGLLGVEAAVEEELARSINLVCAICKLRECMLVTERCYFVLIAMPGTK